MRLVQKFVFEFSPFSASLTLVPRLIRTLTLHSWLHSYFNIIVIIIIIIFSSFLDCDFLSLSFAVSLKAATKFDKTQIIDEENRRLPASYVSTHTFNNKIIQIVSNNYCIVI